MWYKWRKKKKKVYDRMSGETFDYTGTENELDEFLGRVGDGRFGAVGTAAALDGIDGRVNPPGRIDGRKLALDWQQRFDLLGSALHLDDRGLKLLNVGQGVLPRHGDVLQAVQRAGRFFSSVRQLGLDALRQRR